MSKSIRAGRASAFLWFLAAAAFALVAFLNYQDARPALFPLVAAILMAAVGVMFFRRFGRS